MKNYIILTTILVLHCFINGCDSGLQGNNSTITININAQSPGTKQEIDPGTYKQSENGFEYEGYLEEHQWNIRSQNLSSEQQEEWLNFLTKNINTSGNEVRRAMLAPIMIQGLDYVEKKISVEKLFERSIINDSSRSIKFALQKGVNINQQIFGMSPITFAMNFKKINAIKYLAKHGSQIPKDEDFIPNILRHDTHLALLLIRLGANLSLKPTIVSHTFMRLGDALRNPSLEKLVEPYLNILKEVILNGYDINQLWQFTPGINTEKVSAVVDFLIKNNANINHIEKQQTYTWTPLFWAIRNSNQHMAKALLNSGCNVNLKASAGYNELFTPVQFAIKYGDYNMVNLLQEYGVQEEVSLEIPPLNSTKNILENQTRPITQQPNLLQKKRRKETRKHSITQQISPFQGMSKKEIRKQKRELLEKTSSNQQNSILTNSDLSSTTVMPISDIPTPMKNKCPQARITNWLPGSYGNAEPYHIIKDRPKLPIWVRIGFDNDVTQTFVNEFFDTLRSTDTLFSNINPIAHRKFTKEFVITIRPNYTPQEVQILIEKANNVMLNK